ncbi:acetyltransferase [Waddlia chondrophila 2032/99]|uniref:Acetyltransferase n=2 Tax=Waddlia chondrophila TaxID=71667 RepID=D6YTT1_WADCW|nr:acyltransferase [Waddlia chondrophila]ADI37542.1 acetyltransferase [Waddlia chondrophila WSU 86-1044]CCB91798.1 acetyltransferase [Waddlia chondrophila 2032/99]
MSSSKIHPTAIVEEKVQIGDETVIWDHVHVRKHARIGHHSIIGEKSYLGYYVDIGNYVKVNAMVYIPYGVIIEDQCMISSGVVFSNETYPRSMNIELTELQPSGPTAETMMTRVCQGATIGANASIGPGITISPYSLIGMGSVVTRNVPRQGLMVGNPARLIGYVCICGIKIVDFDSPPEDHMNCPRCSRSYTWDEDQLVCFS